MSRLPPLPLLVCAILLSASALAAATPEPVSKTASTGDRMRERVLRMTEFFDTMLPGVLEENNVTVHFKPKFSDLRDNEFWRFPLEVRYGYSNKLELFAGLVPYTPSPFNRGREHRWGPGETKFGGRYDLGPLLGFFDESTIGLETRVPLGKPPVELNDHYTHVKPFVTAARTLRTWPSTTLYTNVAYDRSVKLSPRGLPPAEVVRRHVIEIAPGLLYKPGEFGYFVEYRGRHHAEPDGYRFGHEIQFGAIWDIPLARSESWRLPGKWQLELGYKLSHEEGHDHSHGVSARVNWRTSLREVLSHGKVLNFWNR